MRPTYRLAISALLVVLPSGATAQQIDTLRRPVNQSAVISWLQQNAIPLRHVAAGNGFADLQPLKQILKGVKVVGLGEATHGTREFFQIKHRLLEFLVTEMGFNTFVIEASYSASQPIDDYVLHGKGDPAAALTGQGYAAWDTEEVTAMLEWIRAHNQRVPDEKKVRFVGLDVWNNEIGRQSTLAYLRRVAPERVSTTDALFRNLSAEEARWPLRVDSAAQRRMLLLLPPLQDVIDHLATNKQKLVSVSSLAEFENAARHVDVMKQWLVSNIPAFLPPALSGSARSVSMADNFIYLADRMAPEARFVFWAHNWHITRESRGSGFNVGARLRRKYGDAYYAFGLEFNHGSFQYRSILPGNVLGSLREGALPPAPAGSLPWYLSRTNVGNLIVDLRTARTHPAVLAWLQTPNNTYDVGWAFPAERKDFLQQLNVGSLYDGIVFIDRSTRTTPTRNALRKTSAPGESNWIF